MTLLPPAPFSLDDAYVALDLETTGLSPERDQIIEIGAVKFRDSRVLETFETLVNPYRAIPSFVTQLTGITQRQVDVASPLSAVAGRLLAFVGSLPVVGHNVAFDMDFLAQAGMGLSNPRYDTQDLASVFLPRAGSYALTGLARAMGIAHGRPHRALEDARICHQLFLALLRKAMEAEPGLLAALAAMTRGSQWSMRGLLGGLAAARGQGASSGLGVLGLDMGALRARLDSPRPLSQRTERKAIDPEAVAALFEANGVLSRAFPDYDYRPQQTKMARAVAEALNQGHHLMVEAGTGVGKSAAYLLPAMLFAMANGRRVVVSTNTINLQEQLVSRDIPALLKASRELPGEPLRELRFAHLKGRANYLCFRRWVRLAQSGGLSGEDARMAAKILVWLQDTATGERAEVNIPQRDVRLWNRLSAEESKGCEGREGICFLRAARNLAEAAHLVVVNHALLLADLAAGGGIIPPYDYLIIDEAHHLEEEASRQLGFEVPAQRVQELAAMLEQQVQDAGNLARSLGLEVSQKDRVEGLASEVEAAIPGLRDSWSRLLDGLCYFSVQHQGPDESGNQFRITGSTRKQPSWSDVEVQWEGFNGALLEAARRVDRLLLALEPLEFPPWRELAQELAGWQEKAEEARERVESLVVQPKEEWVYWINLAGPGSIPTLHAAPLNVASHLEQLLFSRKRCVVLTSATLSVGGSMKYMAGRVGVPDAQELILDSPFDFRKAALLLACSDIPEPTEPDYQMGLQDALVRVARASRGGVLGLFTSRATLQATWSAIKPILEREGLAVLAQGIDGPPHRLVESARSHGKAVLLGTNSLWEGVDMPGGLLRVVVLTRLPFTAPAEPLFAARSEEFSAPFSQYAVPHAVLRFRQGFGRLIRGKSDRGVVVVLDRRIRSRNYGNVFLRSLPPCTVREVPLREMDVEVAEWLKGSPRAEV